MKRNQCKQKNRNHRQTQKEKHRIIPSAFLESRNDYGMWWSSNNDKNDDDDDDDDDEDKKKGSWFKKKKKVKIKKYE